MGGDDGDLERRVLDNMGLARYIAFNMWKKAPRTLDYSELESLAYLGLVAATARWAPYCQEKGFEQREEYFTTFLARRIKGSILDSMRSADWVPRSVRTTSKLLALAGSEEGVSVKELADKTGISESVILATLRAVYLHPVSVEAEVVDWAGPETIESASEAKYLLTATAEAVRGLDEESQVVLALHYFLGDELKQVASRLGISEVKVSKIHTSAVLAVRDALLEAAS